MTNKELISILQLLPPDGTPYFSLGSNSEKGDEYRKLCAKAELITEDCLYYLEIGSVEIQSNGDDSGMFANICLNQTNMPALESYEKEFDEQYKKV